MSRVVIHVEGLSKKYRLGAFGASTLGDDLRRMLGKDGSPENSSILWALRDFNLEIREGEILGVIGKNGAGKSTLLKLLSRITAPTSGKIKLKGRIASLLEVGTGMHPELSGRENIFLNGAILGMSREEVARKFDDIAAFAECERFIDTPIKRYSSGMKVRLGFAVAAFLDAEILVVDEVLAVGDAEFQKRALGKMREITASTQRTVLFVSHNMRSISSLCTRAIYLDKGELRGEGEPKSVIADYLGADTESRGEFEFTASGARVTGRVDSGDSTIFEDSDFRFLFEVFDGPKHSDITMNFRNQEGEVIFTASSLVGGGEHETGQEGSRRKSLVCEVPGGFFNSGRFHIDVSLVDDGSRLVHRESNALVLEVFEGKRAVGGYQGRIQGYVVVPFRWRVG